MAVKTDATVLVRECFRLGHVMQQAGEAERRLARNKVFQAVLEVFEHGPGKARGKFPQVVKNAVKIPGGPEGMGKHVVDVVHAGREAAERLELGQKPGKQAE